MAVQSAYRDAQATNDSNRSAQTYKDLNLNFTKHPIKKDVIPLTDGKAVKEVYEISYSMVILKNLSTQRLVLVFVICCLKT